MLFTYNIVVIDETRNVSALKLEAWSEALESKNLR